MPKVEGTDFVFDSNIRLGKGSFAMVYLGRRISDPRVKVAVKDYFGGQGTDSTNARVEENFMKVMQNAPSRHVVKYLGKSPSRSVFILEYCNGGNLEEYLAANGTSGLPAPLVLNFVAQIGEGVRFIHERRIIHRDIKPANILLSTTANQLPCLKISDFNVARIFDNQDDNSIASTETGPKRYIAPEVFTNVRPFKYRKYKYSCDYWSLGCVQYECMSGSGLVEFENQHSAPTWRLNAKMLEAKMADLCRYKGKFPRAHALLLVFLFNALRVNGNSRNLKKLKQFTEYFLYRLPTEELIGVLMQKFVRKGKLLPKVLK